jgi:hypothetical protein
MYAALKAPLFHDSQSQLAGLQIDLALPTHQCYFCLPFCNDVCRAAEPDSGTLTIART